MVKKTSVADDLLVIGRIGAAHGVRGGIKIHSFTEPPENILAYGEWTLRQADKQLSVKLLDCRVQGKALVARLEGLEDREQACALTGYEVCVARNLLPQLDESEYYWHQLQGLQVLNQQEQLLGKVHHLLETGANDVLVVRPCKGSLDERERLLPYVDHCVLQVDLKAGVIQVDWNADF